MERGEFVWWGSTHNLRSMGRSAPSERPPHFDLLYVAILVLVFGVTPPSTAKRDALLQLVDDNVESQPTKIADVIENPLEAPESVAAAVSGTARAS